MKVLLIEDEPPAADRLKRLIKKVNPTSEFVGVIDSVKAAISWFKSNQSPDLVFMDVQLADGVSFEIFENVELNIPIIFTTAYDQYAIKAFKVNSIDYLLKPIDEQDLSVAMNKFKSVRQTSTVQQEAINRLSDAMLLLTKKYKERFVTKVGEHLKFIEVSDILYFYSSEKITFCNATDGRKHILDFTLDQVEHMLDPTTFFRINRKYIVSVNAITDMISHSNSRIKLILKSSDDSDVIVARERINDFKNWLDQ